MSFFIRSFVALVISSGVYAKSAEQIIQQIQDNLNAETAQVSFNMTVETKRSKRNIALESFALGDEKNFIKITYPKKDKGITFLKLERGMWQYVPRIERVIKIPASMMLQSWMGSDFTNEDLAKNDSIVSDYDANLIAQDDQLYQLELIPKDSSAVVWGRIVMLVSKKYLLPNTVKYYDEEGLLVRLLRYKNIRQFDKHYYPTVWEMIPQTKNKKGHKTTITINKAIFNQPINDAYFTKRALKRFSN